jgi:trehalose-phosphatase
VIGSSKNLKHYPQEPMKIIYCTTADNALDLKTTPNTYTSSKINTLFTRNKPSYKREFLCIANIEYFEIESCPQYAKIYENLMNKIVFDLNYTNLDSKQLFEEYVKFNKTQAEKINRICLEKDLLIVNDCSLLLISGMVKCKVCYRNLPFDHTFIERVPYYHNIIQSLFRAQKFFKDQSSLTSFNRFIAQNCEFINADKGGCHFIENYADKYSILECLEKIATAINSDSSSSLLDGSANALNIPYYNTIQNDRKVILTNAPLIHLEAYIKNNPGIEVRYIRDKVELNEEQDRMIQYLSKTYHCVLNVIDSWDYEVIVSEILNCDIFVGSKYFEICKVLRKACVGDLPNPIEMCTEIEHNIGKIFCKTKVYGEEEYLSEFMDLNDYALIFESDPDIDDDIDHVLVEILTKSISHPKNIMSVQNLENISSNDEESAVKDASTNNEQNSTAGSCYEDSISSINSRFGEILRENLNKNKDMKEASAYYQKKNGSGLYQRKQNLDRKTSSRISVSVKEPVSISVNSTENLVAVVEKPPRADSSENNSRSNITTDANRSQKISSNELLNAKQALDSSECEDKDYILLAKKQHEDFVSDNEDDMLFKKSVKEFKSKNTKEYKIPQKLDIDKIKRIWENSNKIALLDYDGTLAKIQPRPEMAKPTEELLLLLKRFNEKGRVIICTGRPKMCADEWFPKEIEVYAEHGACYRKDGKWHLVRVVEGIPECEEIMRYYGKRTPGSIVEIKTCGLCFHYRGVVGGFDSEKLYNLLKRVSGSNVVTGKDVIEVRSLSKDYVCNYLNPAICAGDDRTDEDMFEVSNKISIKIGKEESKANFYVEDVSDMLALMERLIE